MFLTQHFLQDCNHSSDLHGIDRNNSENFLASQSRGTEAIAASVDELDESTYRSPSQQSAIEILRDFEDNKVLELLSAVRLAGQGYCSYLDCLSSEQNVALSHLKTCPDSHILLWLRHSRGREPTPF